MNKTYVLQISYQLKKKGDYSDPFWIIIGFLATYQRKLTKRDFKIAALHYAINVESLNFRKAWKSR